MKVKLVCVVKMLHENKFIVIDMIDDLIIIDKKYLTCFIYLLKNTVIQW